jgi:hypothetical protein
VQYASAIVYVLSRLCIMHVRVCVFLSVCVSISLVNTLTHSLERNNTNHSLTCWVRRARRAEEKSRR